MARILLVSDDTKLIAGLCDRLRRRGHEVRVAFDGCGGYLSAVGDSPDAVVLDAELPAFSAHHVLRLLRASRDTSHMPVLVVSGPDDSLSWRADAWVKKGASSLATAHRIEALVAAEVALQT